VPPSKRAHTGKVAVKESNQRWCSDGFEFRCDNGEKLRVTFALDCCDREALYWAVTTGGFDSETVQDVMPGAVERRFGNELPASPVEWLTDNGSCYRANETRQFARMLGLEPKNTELSASILEDVAVVPQKAVLVQGTIRDNILYGTDDILPDDELFCILNSLGLIKEDCGEHFLAFLDRDINPLGSGLSGGEIQRLCIARALARKKKIIVLDEPTASIGEELAIKIITYIRQHCPTVIITTHNPRILELADHFFDGMSKSCVIAGEGRDQ
ncbi:DDE-type integrase/transposase/recombinase, partial [Escherichia coli]